MFSPTPSSVEDKNRAEQPPSCNTGAQNAVAVNSSLIDWLSFTVKTILVDDVLGLISSSASWVPLPSGRFGYRAGYVFGHISVYFDGADGMGVHIQVSGQGCRELEGMEDWQGWCSFLAGWLARGVSFSRVDVAMDDREGLLDLDLIEQKTRSCELVSRYKQAEPRCPINLATGERKGHSVRFGAGMSETALTIYNKALEQLLPGHWIRVELRTRNKKADMLASWLSSRETLEGLGAFILGLVNFKEPGTSPQKTRWETCSWWSAFLASVEAKALAVAPAIRSLDKVAAWVSRQVAPTLALLVAAKGGSIDCLIDMVVEGRERWQTWHKRLLMAPDVPF
jgi:phage replication initiation protein